MRRIAIVGGGPGGLMAARQIERQSGDDSRVTMFEASDRLGGKLHTQRFDALDLAYESGVAECYDFEAFGLDPLKGLVRELGLTPIATHGGAVALDGVLLHGDDDLARHFGQPALDALLAFRRLAATQLSPAAWSGWPDGPWEDDGIGPRDDTHPWRRLTWQQVLDREVPDATARRYIRVVSHSDLATEPHLVNGLEGLRNFLKSVAGYGAQYTIAGGMEQLPRALAAGLRSTSVRLNAPVLGIEAAARGGYIVSSRRAGVVAREAFDAVIVALPLPYVAQVAWGADDLQGAVSSHLAQYDRRSHYLRVSLCFDRPFWRPHMPGSWTMIDAFGGCCVYDETPRQAAPAGGVLAFLLAGSDALWHSNAADAVLVERMLSALPGAVQVEARQLLREGRVHRWVGALSALPGGGRFRDPVAAHCPDPVAHAGLVMIGDYLSDSTLNGIYRSARLAAALVLKAPDHLACGSAAPATPGAMRDRRATAPPASRYALI